MNKKNITEGPENIVHVMKGEKSLVQKKKYKLIIKEDLPPSALGGAIVELPDGSIRINITLEEIMNEKMSLIKGKIYTKLFSKGQKK